MSYHASSSSSLNASSSSSPSSSSHHDTAIRRINNILHSTVANNVSSSSPSTSASASATVYDVIIIGVGAMGVSAAYHLALAGKSVIGLERYTIGHDNGSSHGDTRITRLAYWEHPNYVRTMMRGGAVPLLRRSFELYTSLSSHLPPSSPPLFVRTGSLDIGPEFESTFAGSVHSCRVHSLPHDILTPAQLKERFPAWSVPAHYRACYQPEGGVLYPERVVAMTAKLARQHGAVLEEEVEVIDVRPIVLDDVKGKRKGVEVHMNDGRVIRGERVIMAAGAWMSTLIAKSTVGRLSKRISDIGKMLKPERQVVVWYDTTKPSSSSPSPSSPIFSPSQFPVWVATLDGSHYYGFPIQPSPLQSGVKIGRYHHAFESIESESSLNDTVARHRTNDNDRTYVDPFVRTMFAPHLRSSTSDDVLKMSTCMFTNTPDEHFIVDPAPDRDYPQISLISACSGHGFKFSPVLGEIMAGFIVDGIAAVEAKWPIAWLDAGRLLGDRPKMAVLNPHGEATA